MTDFREAGLFAYVNTKHYIILKFKQRLRSMKNSEKQKKIVDKKNERLKKHLKETHTNKTKRKKKERE